MLRVAQDDGGNADESSRADGFTQQRVSPFAAFLGSQIVGGFEEPVVYLFAFDRLFSSAAALKSSFVKTTKRPFSYS